MGTMFLGCCTSEINALVCSCDLFGVDGWVGGEDRSWPDAAGLSAEPLGVDGRVGSEHRSWLDAPGLSAEPLGVDGRVGGVGDRIGDVDVRVVRGVEGWLRDTWAGSAPAPTAWLTAAGVVFAVRCGMGCWISVSASWLSGPILRNLIGCGMLIAIRGCGRIPWFVERTSVAPLP